MEDQLPGFVDDGDRPVSAQSTRDDAKERRRQLHKQRQKKNPAMVVSASDNRGPSARPLSRRLSSDTLPPMAASPSRPAGRSASSPTKSASSSMMSPMKSLYAAEDDEEDIDAIVVPAVQTKAASRLSSKMEKLLLDEGLESAYTPSNGAGLRFEVSPAKKKDSNTASASSSASASAAAKAGARSSERSVNLLNPLEFDDLEEFVRNPAPKGVNVMCQISRDKSGLDKGMFPTYTLKMEKKTKDGLQYVFLLAGRKRRKSRTSNYIISTNAADLSRDGDAFAAKLRANFFGTQFTIYDNGANPAKRDQPEFANLPLRKELAAVIYETNLLGFKGPRKMTVVIPGVDETGMPVTLQPEVERDTITERLRTERIEDLLILRNKQPAWNEETQSYVLNFHGRVTQASVKNFQIVHESDEDYVIMQFGRTSESSFTMDYQYPMSALQAFAIALSSFDGKLACE